ncbi:hypothetical protein GC163_00970 [bacterium]|nr:hypothetical protein [bacterium]
MSWTVRILPRAEEDVTEIYDWVSVRSPQGAEAWLAALTSAIDRLPIDPESYGTAPETGLQGFVLRQFLFRTRRGRTYRGIFTLQDQAIYLLRVRGPGQAPLQQIDPVE